MRFETRAFLDGTVDEVERAMLDARYLDYLLHQHGVLLEVQLLDRTDEGAVVRRRVRYRPKPVIATVGPKPVPPEWFAFIEESTYDLTRHELRFTNVPTSAKISRLLVNTGTLRLRPAGTRCERILEGEIKLSLPFFLKPLAMVGERLIQAEGLKIVDAEAPVLNRFIQDVLRPAGSA
ncbi:MAG: hypothetical protein ACLQDQ_12515 [Myxococcaceae bacterium]